MESIGLWHDNEEKLMRKREREEVIRCLLIAEKRDKPLLSTMFSDIYEEKPPHILKQEQDLLKHVSKYPDYYDSH